MARYNRPGWFTYLVHPGEEEPITLEPEIRESETILEAHYTREEWRKHRARRAPWAQWSDRELAGLVKINRPRELGHMSGVLCFVIWQ